MSGHEFEKQVRQKLDDLKLTPTSQVWENIEDGLRKRRRRPAVIYWVPLLAVALTAGGYLLFNQPGNESNPLAVNEKKASPTTQLPSNESESSLSGNETSTNAQDRSTKSNPTSLKKETLSQTDIPSTSKAYLSKEKSTPVKNSSPDVLVISKHSNDVSSKENKARLSNSAKNEETAFADQGDQPSPESTNRLKVKNPFLSLAHQQPASPSHIDAAYRSQKFESVTLSHNVKPGKIKNNRWSYGLSANGGISAVNEGKLIAFNNARVEDVSTVAPFAPQQPYTPSSISPGITYSLGAFVQRALTKKWSLSAGLNYLQLNTHNKVGNEINSRAIVNNGNRGFYFVQSYFTIDQDNTREYRNKYHFIEMPVELHLNVNKSKKLPMYVNTGVSVSRLIKSNSLHFDGTTGVYYRNDKLINRTQVATSAGFTVGLLNRTTRPIQIGPTIRYNVTKILQKDVSARTNFMSFGLDARMFIK